MSDPTLPPPPTPSLESIDDKLKVLDLKLKALDVWTKRGSIVAGILGVFLSIITLMNTCEQGRIARDQNQIIHSQETEKRRVNVHMELKAVSVPPKKAIYLNGTLTNNSARQINIAMIGIRLWNADWSSAIQDNPNYLVYSDNMVADCQPSICLASKNTDKNRLQDSGHPIVLAPGEVHEATYGPYNIPPAEWRSGVWIEGRAYTVEYDEGRCLLVGPPELEGTFPAFCEESRTNVPECYEKANCLYAATAPFFHPTYLK